MDSSSTSSSLNAGFLQLMLTMLAGENVENQAQAATEFASALERSGLTLGQSWATTEPHSQALKDERDANRSFWDWNVPITAEQCET
ncbi:hypothetical protein JCM24511_03413 [Saitozyma sp. JCM 24511]|nr:hypothetical protein JCM24511_03413 [Saitozyma sp. JCM 24511]